MKNCCIRLVLSITISLTGLAANGQESPGPGASGNAAVAPKDDKIPPGTVITAEMTSSVDARKAKPGDVFEAKVLYDVWGESKILIPHNAKLIGRVLEVQPRSKAAPESTLVIKMDKVVLKEGMELPVHASVRNLETPRPASSDPNGVSSSSGFGAGSRSPDTIHVNGPRNQRDEEVRDPFKPPNYKPPNTSKPPSPWGVPSGLPDVDLSSKSDASGTLSVFHSSKRDVKLQGHTVINFLITRIGE
jgi:hypothetical protein